MAVFGQRLTASLQEALLLHRSGILKDPSEEVSPTNVVPCKPEANKSRYSSHQWSNKIHFWNRWLVKILFFFPAIDPYITLACYWLRGLHHLVSHPLRQRILTCTDSPHRRSSAPLGQSRCPLQWSACGRHSLKLPQGNWPWGQAASPVSFLLASNTGGQGQRWGGGHSKEKYGMS